MKNKFRDGLIIMGVTFFLLVLIEMSLRAIYPHKINETVKKEYSIEYDKDCLYRLKPNLNKLFYRHPLNGGDTIAWQSNSNGFRGKEIKTNPATRIMVYGDSNILAKFSSLNNTFPSKLQSYLAMTTNSEIEVLNAGVFGFGPDQSFMKIKQQIGLYKPDVIVFHVFADNDFGDLIRNQIFYMNDDNQLCEKVVPRDTIIMYEDPSFFSSLLIVKATSKVGRILIKNEKKKQTSLYKKWCKDEFNCYANDVIYEHDFMDHYDFDLSVNPSQESSITKNKLFGGIIKELNRFLKSLDVKVIILIQPSIVDLIESNERLDFPFLERNYLGYNKRNLTNFVEAICIENKIDFINLFDIFSTNHPEKLYFISRDDHWNDLGQDLAAKKTAAYFINNNLIKLNL
jgi:hypothetical protein